MLLEDLKRYIDSKINADVNINTKVLVKEQYPYGERVNPPEILIDLIDDIEYTRATTFGGERAATIPLQMIVVTNQMTISQVRMSSQSACRTLGRKLDRLFDKTMVVQSIPSILTIRRVQHTSPMPYDHGVTTYYSILRFELVVAK